MSINIRMHKGRKKLVLGLAIVTALSGIGCLIELGSISSDGLLQTMAPVHIPERFLRLPEPGLSCERWEPRLPPIEPSADLEEMSGIVSSRQYRNILYHIADSGNPPFILVTDYLGRLLHEFRYAESTSDPEALSQGPCPWGGSCLFVADTGDNFHIRSKKRIHAIDETSMYTPSLHSAELEFHFPKLERLDVEAMAVHPLSGDMFLFSKEFQRSRVFRLPAQAWQNNNGKQMAESVGFFLYDHITDAAWSADGKRLLLINWQGIFERTGQLDAEHSEREGWLPYERKIRLLPLGQQEAVAYLPDQRSIVYSSEKKLFSERSWGLVVAPCIPGH